MDHAVKITAETLPLIRPVNDGVTPELEDFTTFFVNRNTGFKPNLILNERDFRENFAFVGPELYNQFTAVKEI